MKDEAPIYIALKPEFFRTKLVADQIEAFKKAQAETDAYFADDDRRSGGQHDGIRAGRLEHYRLLAENPFIITISLSLSDAHDLSLLTVHG